MRSAFYLLAFPNSIFAPFCIWKFHVLSGEMEIKNNHYYYYFKFIGNSKLTPSFYVRFIDDIFYDIDS